MLLPNGANAKANELGRIVVKLPLPPGNMSTLYKNEDLFEAVYFKKFPVSKGERIKIKFKSFLKMQRKTYCPVEV